MLTSNVPYPDMTSVDATSRKYKSKLFEFTLSFFNTVIFAIVWPIDSRLAFVYNLTPLTLYAVRAKAMRVLFLLSLAALAASHTWLAQPTKRGGNNSEHCRVDPGFSWDCPKNLRRINGDCNRPIICYGPCDRPKDHPGNPPPEPIQRGSMIDRIGAPISAYFENQIHFRNQFQIFVRIFCEMFLTYPTISNVSFFLLLSFR